MSEFAYAIFYEAFRAGAVRKYQLMFTAEEQISGGEAFQAMAEQVCRTAVNNGQANSLDDVSITGVSLLNNPVAVSEQDASIALSGGEHADLANNQRQPEHIAELEAAVVELYQDLKSAIDGDLDNNLGKIALENHEGVYVTCINRD